MGNMANVNPELKIDDDYIKEQAKLIAEWSEDIQKGIDKYISILNNILEDAIIEGSTADALSVFSEYVANLKEIISKTGLETKGLCVNFVLEIDDADSFLY